MGKPNKTQMARARRHARVRETVVGTIERPRLNVYRSLNNIYAQIIDDSQGHTLVAVSSCRCRELRMGWRPRRRLSRPSHVGKGSGRTRAGGRHPASGL